MTFKKILFLLAFISTISFSGAFASQDLVFPIVGGQVVEASDPISKSVAAIYFQVNEKGGALCTGSILDAGRILTAAHCVDGVMANKGIVIFKTDINTPSPSDKSLMRRVTGFVKSADFPGSDQANHNVSEFHDLAIVTFDGGIPAGFTPVKILSGSQFTSLIKRGVKATIAGYGITALEKTANELEYMDHDYFLAGEKPEIETSGVLRKTNMAVVGMMPKGIDIVLSGVGHSSCHGDSGGPAMVQISGENYLFGVLSRGDCVKASIYTKYIQSQTIDGLL